MGHEYTHGSVEYEEQVPCKEDSQMYRDLRRYADKYVYDNLDLDKWEHIYSCLDCCNTEQLWALYNRFIKNGTQFEIAMFCKREGYLGITIGNLFVGIEADGYTHS